MSTFLGTYGACQTVITAFLLQDEYLPKDVTPVLCFFSVVYRLFIPSFDKIVALSQGSSD